MEYIEYVDEIGRSLIATGNNLDMFILKLEIKTTNMYLRKEELTLNARELISTGQERREDVKKDICRLSTQYDIYKNIIIGIKLAMERDGSSELKIISKNVDEADNIESI